MNFHVRKCTNHFILHVVRSQLEYCSSVWAPYFGIHSDRIESIQKKFLRFVYLKFNLFRYVEFAPYSFRRSLLGLQSLSDRRRNTLAFFVFDLLVGRIDSVVLLSKININIPIHCLRSNSFLHINYHRTSYGKFEPINLMCTVFNEFFYLFDFNMSRVCYRAALVHLDAALYPTG